MALSDSEYQQVLRRTPTSAKNPDSLVRWTPPDANALENIGYFSKYGIGLTTLTFLHRRSLNGFDFETTPDLQKIDFPYLEEVDPDNLIGGKFAVSQMENLIECTAPHLRIVGGLLGINNCPLITSISLPDFEYSEGGLVFQSNTACTDIFIPRWRPSTVAAFLGGTIDASECALTQECVDRILINAAAVVGFSGGVIELSGGTNATPSAAGLAAKATLEGRSVTVNVN